MKDRRTHFAISDSCVSSLPFRAEGQVTRPRHVSIRKDSNGVDREVYTENGAHQRCKIGLLDISSVKMGQAPRFREAIMR